MTSCYMIKEKETAEELKILKETVNFSLIMNNEQVNQKLGATIFNASCYENIKTLIIIWKYVKLTKEQQQH